MPERATDKTGTVSGLGNRGDGMVQIGQDVYHVPFALPGEQVRFTAGRNSSLLEVIEPSPERVPPVCPYYTRCGGCQMQHQQPNAYQNWKVAIVETALARVAIDIKPEPMVSFPLESRRRAVFSSRNADGQIKTGFSVRSSHEIEEIGDCPLLVPEINSKLPLIRKLAKQLNPGRKGQHISVLATQNGLDVSLAGAAEPSSDQRKTLIRLAADAGFARLSFGDEVLVEYAPPKLMIGDVPVVPAPGSFVQAIAAAEEAMAASVLEHLAGCKRVADLFCGFGPFALRLAKNSTVLACENDAGSVAALDQAWRRTAGELKQITTEVRDLDRRPVFAQELEKIDGLVFDPPRAGAEAQSFQIAKSKVKRLAAVSCNPVTLARDLRILIDGGYRLDRLVPIDQFRFTPHVEIVALLSR